MEAPALLPTPIALLPSPGPSTGTPRAVTPAAAARDSDKDGDSDSGSDSDSESEGNEGPLKRARTAPVASGSSGLDAGRSAGDADTAGIAAAKEEVDSIMKTIGLRKPRLIEAILTRKERNVNELANSMTSWL